MKKSREQVEFERAIRDIGKEEGNKMFADAFKSCRQSGMSEKGAQEFAQSSVVGYANWIVK